MRLLLACALLALGTSVQAKNFVCYYGSWAVYRWGDGKFDVENIDPFLCTDLVYTFAGLSSDYKMISLDEYNDLYDNWGKGAYTRFTNLKKQNPALRTWIAIGGWNEGSEKYSRMASTAVGRATFIQSAREFVLKYNFNGLDIDWEYPGLRGGDRFDRYYFNLLVQELRAEFDKYGLLLSAAVGVGKDTTDAAYDIPTMSKYLDYINMMAYDLHGSWEPQTGMNAPLYAQNGDLGTDLFLNVNYSVNYWLSLGAPREKLNLGLGLYGRSWTLSNPSSNGVRAPSSQPGNAGRFTGENGFLGYYEICTNIKNGWTKAWDKYSQCPYAYFGNQWVGYDDVESIRIKSQYINSMGLGGGMVWSIETDDFKNLCGDGKNPLMNTIKQTLGSGAVLQTTQAPAPTPAPATTTTKAPATTAAAVATTTAAPAVTTATGQTTSAKRFVCYYGSWAVYRPGNGKFDVEQIDPFLCTDVVYTFAGLSPDNKIISLDEWNDLYDNWGKGAYTRFTNLKKKNPKLKTWIAIGGWNEGSEKYSRMAYTAANRATFVQSARDFLLKYNFDGLDIDWEYPALRGGDRFDRYNLNLLVKELRTEFDKYGLLLSAAVGVGKSTTDAAYDIPTMSQYLHYINMMAYDYHGSWETVTGMNAPLYAQKVDVGENLYLNVNYSVNYWISLGAPREKLNLGLGLYGRAWTLNSPAVNGVGAGANNPGTAGEFSREAGFLTYYEICTAIKSGWTTVWDQYSQGPYSYSGYQWVGYDNVQSLKIKTKFINDLGLGGGMVWSLESDDFRNLCGQGANPLMTVIKETLGAGVEAPTTAAPTTTTAAPTTTTTTAARTTTTTKAPTTTTTTTAAPTTTTAAPTTRTTTTAAPTTTTTTTAAPTTTTTTTAAPTTTTTTTAAPTTTTTTTAAPTTTTTTTAAPTTTTTTTKPTTTTKQPTGIQCNDFGFAADPIDCTSFYRCVYYGSTVTYYKMTCAPGTIYNHAIMNCVFGSC